VWSSTVVQDGEAIFPSQGTDLPMTEVEKHAVKGHVASMPTEDILDRFS